ncbi:hypothetical protein Syun_031083 [Stephania yunnanensis]|uniref:Uncharacterized protein n=1 Tax=Stephania yunnanensis TaxID=152371 RepID=A0AAP0DW83_9MAGN
MIVIVLSLSVVSPLPQLVRLLLRRPLSRRGCMLCVVLQCSCRVTFPDSWGNNAYRLSRHLTGLILLLEAIRLATIKGLNGSLCFQACLPREEFDEEKELMAWSFPDGYKLVQQRMVNVLRLRMGKARLRAKRKLAEISVDSNSVNSLAASDLVSKKSLDHGDGNNAVVMIDDEELEGSKKKRLR